jgi:hypothetical protein
MQHNSHIPESVSPQLQDLLSAKNFNALSADEKDFVLKYISEEQYNSYKNIQLQSAKQFGLEEAQIQAPKYLFSNIKTVVKERNAKEENNIGILENLRNIFSYRLPMYQPALAMLLLIALFFFWRKEDNAKPVTAEKQIVYVPVTDTFYIERDKDSAFEVKFASSRKGDKAASERSTKKDRKYKEPKAFLDQPIYVKQENTTDVKVTDFRNTEIHSRSLADDSLVSQFAAVL